MEQYLPHFKHDGEGVVAVVLSSLFIIHSVLAGVIAFPSSTTAPTSNLAKR